MKKLFLIALSNLPMLTYAVDWSISPTSKNIGTGGGSFSITISNPTDNALEYAAGADVDWITIAPRNYYATTVNASVDANGNLIYSRSGYVTVSAYLHGQTHNYVNSKGYRRCYVTQSGQGASFSPSSVSFAGTNSAATITVNVKTGISWELESSADWLSLDDTSGTGSKVVKVLASINETGIARSATIKIYDEGVGCSAPYSLTVTQAPLPPSHFITYENTMGADNPNPATYIEGESFTFDPLDAIVGYSFAGWIPDCINETNTQDMIVSATWAPVSYQVAYEPNGGMGQMNATSVVYDVEFLISDNEFTWENHEFLGWALAHDAGVSYNAGDVVSNLTSTANDIVTLYAVWKKLLVAPVITPNDGHVFYGNSCEVTISCPTEGAVIYYTTNGNTPKTTSANLYGGPFIIDETTTVRAVAVKDDKKQYSVAVITKSSLSLTLETALGNADGIVITTGGPAEWNAIVDDTATSGLSVQSGEIQDSNESWLQATVRGEGTISFLSKTSCEHDEENTFTWDCLKVFVDGNERPDWRMDGESDWTIRTITFESADTHTVRWVYHKDDSEKEGDDCAWVSGLTWSPVRRQTFYVDATNGNDMADGFTKATAVATLQEAVDRTVDGDTIIVADGTYAPIHVGDKRITIESENGYKRTIIDGGGTNGCLYAIYSIWGMPSTNAVLRGFTLANGYSYRGAGACGGTLERCLIVGNVAFNEEPGYGAAYYYGQGGGAYGSMLRYCTIVNNTAEFWPGNEWEEDPQTSGGEGGGVYGCTLENCIVYGNEGEIAPDASNSEYSSDSLVGVDPLFVNAANGDYRLTSASPCAVDGVATAGCETEIMSGTVPGLTPAQAAAWITTDLASRYAKSGENAADYQNRFEAKFGADPVAAMTMPTDKKDVQGNDMYVWQDYVAGTDPTDTNSVFTATITIVDGAPVVEWSPKLSAGEEARRSYTIYGKTNLADKAWHSPTNSSSRFFKVGVELR